MQPTETVEQLSKQLETARTALVAIRREIEHLTNAKTTIAVVRIIVDRALATIDPELK